MLRTEAEAKEMLCPIRAQYEDECCLGSKCMGWRWSAPLSIYPRRKRIPRPHVVTMSELNRKMEDLEEKGRSIEDYIHSLVGDYQEEPERRDVPESWEYVCDFEDWWEGFFVGWIEPESEAREREARERRGYCGMAGMIPANPASSGGE